MNSDFKLFFLQKRAFSLLAEVPKSKRGRTCSLPGKNTPVFALLTASSNNRNVAICFPACDCGCMDEYPLSDSRRIIDK